MRGDVLIRFHPAAGSWEGLGIDRFKGVTAEGIEATANAWGPDRLGFALKAQAGAERPDLAPFTPVELEIGGLRCWTGRTIEKPSQPGQHQVECEGWQYHLDDDLFDRLYVHQRLQDWRDMRSHLDVNITSWQAAFGVEVGSGSITISLPQNTTCANQTNGGVFFDAGPDSTIKRVILTYESGAPANFQLLLHGLDSIAGGAAETVTLDAAPIAAGPTTVAHTFTTARRFVRLLMRNATGGVVTGVGTTDFVRLSSIILFRDTAYESGNASILEADEVIRDALAFAPLLNQATGEISDATFAIPEWLTSGYLSPRQVMEAVNAYENYRLKLGGGDLKTLVFDSKPSVPLVEVGEWSGASFTDSSVSGEEIYSRAIVDATGPDGGRLVAKRTQTGTLVDRNGFTRSRVLPVSTAVTQAVAQRFGDLWLEEHRTAPFSGKLSVEGDEGIRSVQGGGAVPAHAMLLYAGEKIRLSNRIDPDTGAIGRDGRIAAVTYRHDDRAVEIDIDDRRTSFERLLSRYGLLVDQLS